MSEYRKAWIKMLLLPAAMIAVPMLLWFLMYMKDAVDHPEFVSPLWDIGQEHEEAILAVESGWYNDRLPIFAREIHVQEVADGYVRYKVLYFPFGSIERSYSREPDGKWLFNLEKPLTGI